MLSTVLIVEGDAQLNNVINQYFEIMGFTAFSATSLHKALKILKVINIDLIIFDLEVPDARNIEPQNRIASLWQPYQQPRLIIVTGTDPNDLPIELHQHPIVEKPASLRRLLHFARDDQRSKSQPLGKAFAR
jgi:DNA-binding response OmpR family regulator